MSTTKRPTTPLRRISRGSLNALSQSRGHSSATPLSFLERAVADLVDETSVLQANLEQVEAIHGALSVFNESFAMYIYGLKMNAFCVDWPEAPNDEHFDRAEQRLSSKAQQMAAQQRLQDLASSSTTVMEAAYDQTYMTVEDDSIYPAVVAPPPPKSALKKPSTTTTPATKVPASSARTARGAARPATRGRAVTRS